MYMYSLPLVLEIEKLTIQLFLLFCLMQSPLFYFFLSKNKISVNEYIQINHRDT